MSVAYSRAEEFSRLAAILDALSPGLILSNPPYGVRLGDLAETLSLYARFGATGRAGSTHHGCHHEPP